jgi:glucose/mannose-6-phosphate isomerase
MLCHLNGMSELCQDAWQMSEGLKLPWDGAGINKVVICGMGGSAIGGEMASRLLMAETKIPILVHRERELPAFVDANTLVITSSYSGMTEETLSCFYRALETGARILVITHGGRLDSLARENNIPVFNIDYDSPPRATLPFSLFAILFSLQKLGFISDKTRNVRETVSVLKDLVQCFNQGIPTEENRAKQLAVSIHGHLTVIYGAGILSPVARRWKTQFNENSKAWAFYETFPELNHNAVAGYHFPRELVRRLMVVLLRSSQLEPRITRQYQALNGLLDEAKVEHRTIETCGQSPLSRMMSLVLLGDYVSVYLALLYRVDPSPVKALEYLKEELRKNSH